jgi:hypothetical protein
MRAWPVEVSTNKPLTDFIFKLGNFNNARTSLQVFWCFINSPVVGADGRLPDVDDAPLTVLQDGGSAAQAGLPFGEQEEYPR